MKGKVEGTGGLLVDLVPLTAVVAEVVSTMRRGEMENAHAEPLNVEVGLGVGKSSFPACVTVINMSAPVDLMLIIFSVYSFQ